MPNSTLLDSSHHPGAVDSCCGLDALDVPTGLSLPKDSFRCQRQQPDQEQHHTAVFPHPWSLLPPMVPSPTRGPFPPVVPSAHGPFSLVVSFPPVVPSLIRGPFSHPWSFLSPMVPAHLWGLLTFGPFSHPSSLPPVIPSHTLGPCSCIVPSHTRGPTL